MMACCVCVAELGGRSEGSFLSDNIVGRELICRQSGFDYLTPFNFRTPLIFGRGFRDIHFPKKQGGLFSLY